MEYEKIKQLMDDMGNSKLTSISIDFPDGTKITMTKDDENKKVANATKKEDKDIANAIENDEEIEEYPEEIEENFKVVKAPMLGTFYSKPSPSSGPYVSVGDTVKVGDILCIVEAMKLMNEIESEYEGTIVEILVKDGDPVEYGTPLFKIK